MKITIETNIAAPIADVWRAFNSPDDILQWDTSNDWHTTWASNDLKVGGKLLLRIEPDDGGTGFDFAATYTQIEPNRLIEFREDDGHIANMNGHITRVDGHMVRVEFIETDMGVTVRQTFDAEPAHTEEHQRADWQSVIDRFAGHVESITNPQQNPYHASPGV